MRRGYRISLFIVCVGLLVLVGLLVWKRQMLYQEQQTPYIEEIQSGDEAAETQKAETATQCDTQGLSKMQDTSAVETGYYLMVTDEEVWVYQADKTTRYFKTDLQLTELPESVQQEIIAGKYIESELAVYHFLESYSS